MSKYDLIVPTPVFRDRLRKFCVLVTPDFQAKQLPSVAVFCSSSQPVWTGNKVTCKIPAQLV